MRSRSSPMSNCAQLAAQIVEKTPQRIGNVNHQGEYIQSLFGWNLGQHPARMKIHALSMLTVLWFLSRTQVPGTAHLIRWKIMQPTSDTNPLLPEEFTVPFDRIGAGH